MITRQSLCTALAFAVLAGFILFVIFPIAACLNNSDSEQRGYRQDRNGNIGIGASSLYDTTTGTLCDWARGTIIFDPNCTGYSL